MCGIAGKYYFDLSKKVSAAAIQKMSTAISHRGPDSHGQQLFGHAGFGHRRLAIIDLSTQGHQPMSYLNKRYWITFNGEIYNYQQLKDTLIKKGHRFHSKTDTEVILALYHEYGPASVKKIRGMFAFAIYDTQSKTLFAARDRLGQKPFKYYLDDRVFIFASELKAILTQPEVKTKLDPAAIQQYLYWGYVPSPKTGFSSLKKLPAGHSLLIKEGKCTITRYWDYTPTGSITDPHEAGELIRKTLTESVKMRLMSDVPLGAFLSGGIDSTIIVGLMSQLAAEPIHTYTVGFDGWANDESAAAKITAALHKTDHTTLQLTPKIGSAIDAIAQAYEEPFGDVSAIPSYAISQAAKEHVTVVLNGDGGDENFIGYSNYTTFLDTSNYTQLWPLLAVMDQVLKKNSLGKNQSGMYHSSFLRRVQRITDILGQPRFDSYLKYARGYLNVFSFNQLFSESGYDPIDDFRQIVSKQTPSEIEAITYLDLHTVLPDGLMPKVDIASMQFGLETRAPFLDHKLVEAAAKIHPSLKYHQGTTKHILREAFADLIPPEIAQLPKRGFVIPVEEWLASSEGRARLKKVTTQTSPLYPFLNQKTISDMANIQLSGTENMSFMLWRIIMLDSWLRSYARYL